MDANDFMTFKAMESGMSPYEQVKVGHMQAKGHTSGVAIAGLVLGTVGTAAAVGSWIFSPLYGSAKANQAKEAAYAAKELAIAKNDGLRDLVQTLASTVAAERNERIQGDVTLNQTITDTVSGQQASTLTAQQQAELAASQATQQVMTQTYSDFVTGRASLNPTPVSLYSSPQPCSCPNSCGCNG